MRQGPRQAWSPAWPLERREHSLVAAMLVLLVVGCREPLPPAPPPPARTVDQVELGEVAGADLVASCSPTGPELCFNALDDNCNGLLDEGCGVRTGLVQFMVAWEEVDVDVDLFVTDPDGEVAAVDQVTGAGMTKQQDCPGNNDACYGQNYENVYSEGESAVPGTYVATVRLESLGDTEPPVRVSLGARIGGQSQSAHLVFDREGQEQAVRYRLRGAKRKALPPGKRWDDGRDHLR